MTEEEKRLQELEAENQKLREEIESLRPSFKKRIKKGFKRGKLITEAYLGRGLKNSIQKFLTELTEQRTISKDTVSDLSARLVMRFTRLGRIGFLLALIPILFTLFQTWLLFNQNEMIEKQNQIAEKQTEIAKKQTDLMGVQNNMVQNQTALMDSQTNIMKFQNLMFDEQNKMVGKQTTMIDWQNRLFENQNLLVEAQNKRVDQQTYLVEAQRRSALVFLMGNIFDEVNNELKGKKGKERQLSPQLIGRIIALSHSLTPYKFLVGDNLTDREYSPERGQLLITLVNSDIDSASLETIYFNANFTQSYLENVTFKEKNLKYCDLSKSNLKRANLQSADLSFTKFVDATLIGADFSFAKLFKTDFNDANLRSAFLHNANFNIPNLIGVLIDRRTIINMDDINKYRMCFYDIDTKTGTKIYQLSQVDCSDAPNKKQKESLKNYHSE